MSADFLLELRSEEIPARMQDKARDDLARLFTAELAKAGLKSGAITTYATPRRLTLIARDLPLETQAVSEETKGPKTSAPPQALEGFLRKTGLAQDQLVERDGVYFAVIERPGRATADVLAEAIPAIIRSFPWPKSQRWGAASISTESLRWVRPLQGIIALLGDTLVPCEVEGIVSGATTTGHRFHHQGNITIANAGDYAAKLRAAFVIVDQDERRSIIRAGAEKAAADAGLVLVPDEGLVGENAGLTEWPVPMLGRFDAAFLAVPEEVIQLTARVNQKYFVCHDSAGKLANAFVCTANLEPRDGGAAVVAGNEKVLAARLSDAKFFYEADLKVALDVQAEKLSNIVFHEKLGTVADKVERVAKLARWLVTSGVIPAKAGIHEHEVSKIAVKLSAEPPIDSRLRGNDEEVEALADMAERAASLCKADLVTGMVGEFPELQGIMGGYYARAQGEPHAVADAVRDHYKPVGQGDDVPTALVTVAVSLADKLDTIFSFFAVNERPTGSKDPFAIRRAALGAMPIIFQSGSRLNLNGAIATIVGVIIDQAQRRLANVLTELTSGGETQPTRYGFKRLPDGRAYIMAEASVGTETATTAIDLPVQHSAKVGYDLDIVRLDHTFLRSDILDFFADRLKVQQREAGVRHDLIDAVFALGGEDDLVRLLARVKALQAFVSTDEGVNLLAGYKRAANILKAANDTGSSPAKAGAQSETSDAALRPDLSGSRLRPSPENAEAALQSALGRAEPLAAAAIAREDFGAAMTALASLRAPIDAFFEGVMVNDPDPDTRAYRLGLLVRFRDAVHKVADFSKIEG